MRNNSEIQSNYFRIVKNLQLNVPLDKTQILDYLRKEYDSSVFKGATFYDEVKRYAFENDILLHPSYSKKLILIGKCCDMMALRMRNENTILGRDNFANAKFIIGIVAGFISGFALKYFLGC